MDGPGSHVGRADVGRRHGGGCGGAGRDRRQPGQLDQRQLDPPHRRAVPCGLRDLDTATSTPRSHDQVNDVPFTGILSGPSEDLCGIRVTGDRVFRTQAGGTTRRHLRALVGAVVGVDANVPLTMFGDLDAVAGDDQAVAVRGALRQLRLRRRDRRLWRGSGNRPVQNVRYRQPRRRRGARMAGATRVPRRVGPADPDNPRGRCGEHTPRALAHDLVDQRPTNRGGQLRLAGRTRWDRLLYTQLRRRQILPAPANGSLARTARRHPPAHQNRGYREGRARPSHVEHHYLPNLAEKPLTGQF